MGGKGEVLEVLYRNWQRQDNFFEMKMNDFLKFRVKVHWSTCLPSHSGCFF